MAGKGSKPRPMAVNKKIFDENWDNIFNKNTGPKFNKNNQVQKPVIKNQPRGR